MSKFGRTTTLISAVGYSGMFTNAFIGPPSPFPGSALVSCLRVMSMVTSG